MRPSRGIAQDLREGLGSNKGVFIQDSIVQLFFLLDC